jgi:hypothetical protein
MGYDATCTLNYRGKSTRGTALLEHKELLFRGAARLAIPLAAITSATARDGVLRVEFDGHSAELAIGAAAEKWAKRITSPPSRLDKLGIKPTTTAVVLGVKDADFIAEIAGRASKVSSRKPSVAGSVDVIFYRADDRAALEQMATFAKLIKPDGAVWILRPKGRKEITEGDTMAAGKRAGLVDVKVVSFSDEYSAEKFVIPVARRGRS